MNQKPIALIGKGNIIVTLMYNLKYLQGLLAGPNIIVTNPLDPVDVEICQSLPRPDSLIKNGKIEGVRLEQMRHSKG